jgi:hypothetical protein
MKKVNKNGFPPPTSKMGTEVNREDWSKDKVLSQKVVQREVEKRISLLTDLRENTKNLQEAKND